MPGAPADRTELVDRLFFGFGTVAAVWLAWDLARASLDLSWWSLALLVVFWLVLAYLALPRLNRILSSIYVPDYFIGRTRTSDGLLGDPLNLAFRGTGEQLSTALGRAGWIKADPVTLASSVHIITATLSGRSYSQAPVSPLMLFGRQQDAAFQQEVAGNPGQRHHVRLWRTPPGWVLPGGHRVDWLAGGTYDRRVGLSLFTLQVTHKIDADIDVERDFITDSILRAEPAATVEPLLDFTTGYHSRNGGGDTVHTDGTLPVVDLAAVAPGAGADPLVDRPDQAARPPLQVLLPAVLAIVVGPAVLLDALGIWTGDASTAEHLLLGFVVALAVASLACAVMMLRRSAWSRRWLLLLSCLIAVAQFVEYDVSDVTGTQLAAVRHAGVTIMAVLALSSPVATAWCRRGSALTS
nr:LssY C-terminal domain-containing protein [Nocardioides panaciterrulae]